MAQKIQILYIDDLDGTEAEGTVRFGLDGTEYEIDLNAEHAQALQQALALCTCCPPDRGRYPAASPQQTRGASKRAVHHRGPRVGQSARHRRERPWTGACRAGHQVQGRNGEVRSGTFPVAGTKAHSHADERAAVIFVNQVL